MSGQDIVYMQSKTPVDVVLSICLYYLYVLLLLVANERFFIHFRCTLYWLPSGKAKMNQIVILLYLQGFADY
jgi:hypothetical protein